METAKRIIFLLMLAVLVISPVQSAEEQTAQISNTRTANCLVKVTCDPVILPLNLETLDYLLHSSGVGGRARREVLGISPDQDYDLFTVEYVQSFASDELGDVGLRPRDSRTGRPSVSEDDMDEYEYAMMMEMEMGQNRTYRSQPGTSSSTDRSRSSSSTAGQGDKYDELMYEEMMKDETVSNLPVRPSSSSRLPRTRSTTQPAVSGIYGTSVSRSRSSRDRSRSRTPFNSRYGSSEIPQRRTGTTAVTAAPDEEQTYLFRLNVHLPEDVKPLAKEFMQMLLAFLRESLHEAHNTYLSDLRALLEDAESWRDRTRSRLAEVMGQIKAVGLPPKIKQNPADAAVYEQLEQIIDLSHLTSSTSFADVLESLKNSVDPPLQIQPNWRDLLENAEVEQTTPAGMDPLTGIKLRKALEILLDGISGDFAEVGYVVDEGVILIATPDSLPSNMVTGVYEIPALAYSPGSARELIETIRNTIDPESWFELGMGEGSITPYPRQQPKKLAILQTYENHQKIWEFLQNIDIDIPTTSPSDIPREMLFGEKDSLLAEKQNLEMELARAQGRMPAIDVQIVRIKKEIEEKIQDDQISQELRKILDLQIRHLESVKKLDESGRAQPGQVADAEEKVARANIELARRRDQIGVTAGSDQLIKYTNELATLTIEMAEKKAILDVVNKQLDQTQQQLTVADMSDPQVSRIRMATQALEIAERHVNELNARLASLQLPLVSVLGGN